MGNAILAPMLLSKIDRLSLEEQTELYEDANEWVAQEKHDGVRILLHVTPEGNRMYTRTWDPETQTFNEKSDWFIHLRDQKFPGYEGTVLDGELLIPGPIRTNEETVTDGSFHSTVAVLHTTPQNAKAIQDANSKKAELHIFDVAKAPGWLVSHPYLIRRMWLEEFFAKNLVPSEFKLVQDICVGKRAFVDQIFRQGKEGVVFRHIEGQYEPGKRSRWIVKVKNTETVDAFVSGWIPGRGIGNAGQVGGLLVSVWTEEGVSHEVAGVTVADKSEEIGKDREFRQAITVVQDGEVHLRSDMLNRVVEITGKCWNKNVRLCHARIVRWRPDKSADECRLDVGVIRRKLTEGLDDALVSL